ncbi:hypothetical protein GOBAR_AA12367 [Gossypium barbadense]|uniref:Uncharacterized protein n=1 Tax=Gossypium barbadense TaxID=3634 RepID=A0A2P5XY62_GOSBA|nr:hypothetical protein GOBAR_AA12367 [Gossypium barbadense]
MTLQKLSFKDVHEPCSGNDRGHVYEERRLQIEELDEWRAHKSKTRDKSKLHQNKPDTSPNQLKVGDKVLLCAADLHIVTTTQNEEIPLTVLSIFPFDTVEVNHPKFVTFKVNTGVGIEQHGRAKGKARFCFFDMGVKQTRACKYLMSSSRGKKAAVPSSKRRRGPNSSSVCATDEVRNPFLEFPQASQEELFQILHAWPLTTGRCIDWATVEQVVMTNNDDPSTIHFRLGGLVCAMSVPEFGVSLEPYTDEFIEEEDINALPRNIHISPSLCWKALAPLSSTYDPSRSKASALPISLRYLHAILAHTLTGRRESTSIINTHDAYYLWCMVNAHVTDLAYFIAFAIRHQTERHQKGVISIGPYVTRLARHFGLLNIVAQSSALTLIGQMSPQGITTMLHMRMIERRLGPILLSTVSLMPLTRRILRTFLMMSPHSTRSLLPRHLGNNQFMRLLYWHTFPTDSFTLRNRRIGGGWNGRSFERWRLTSYEARKRSKKRIGTQRDGGAFSGGCCAMGEEERKCKRREGEGEVAGRNSKRKADGG